MASKFRICGTGRKGLSTLLLLWLSVFITACQPTPEERLTRAQDYFEQSEYRASILELKNALQRRPEFAEARLLLARSSYQLADFQTAQTEYEKTLAQGLDRPDVWEGLGRTLLSIGQVEAVLERVEPNLNFDTVGQNVLLANTYLALGNVDEAANKFAAARAIDEFAADAIVGEAVIAAERGAAVDAQALLDLAKSKHPNSDVVWRAVANYHRATRNFEAAASAYDRAITYESGNTPLADRLMARVNRVSTLIDIRDLDTADARLTQLNSEFPSHPVLRFLRGRLAYAQGDLDTAQTELRGYLADIPNDLRGFALLGAVNFSQNHLLQAESYLAQAARGQVGGDMTTRLLAETRLRLNKPGEALGTLGSMAASDMTDPSLLAMYGRAQLGLGNTAAALDYFEEGAAVADRSVAESLAIAAGFFTAGENDRAIELLKAIPDHQDDRFQREALLMAALMREGRRDETIAVGQQLLADNAGNAAAFATVGVMWQSLGDIDKARGALGNAVAIDPTNRAANYALGRLNYDAGDLAASEQNLVTILGNDPAFMPALSMLASILANRGEVDELKRRASDAVSAQPTLLEPRLLYARVLMMSRDVRGALGAITEARQEFPNELRLTHLEGIVNFQAGKSETALTSLRRAANGDRGNALFQYDLASVAVAAGDLAEAGDAIARFRELRPDDFRGVAMLVAILSQQKQFADARAAIASFTSKNPADAIANSLAGDVEMAAGEHDAALQFYEASAEAEWTREIAIRLSRARQALEADDYYAPLKRWIDENPGDDDARRLYAQMLEASGNTDLAVSQYESLLATNNNDPIALNNLAWQYAEQGKSGAIELAERAHRLAPDNGNITDTLGWIHFQAGNMDQALSLLEQAAQQKPDDLDIQFHLAAALARSGDKERASAIITEALLSGRPFSSKTEAEALAQSL